MKGLLVVLSVGTLLATGLVRGGDAKKDTAGLQGTWKADLGEKNSMSRLGMKTTRDRSRSIQPRSPNTLT